MFTSYENTKTSTEICVSKTISLDTFSFILFPSILTTKLAFSEQKRRWLFATHTYCSFSNFFLVAELFSSRLSARFSQTQTRLLYNYFTAICQRTSLAHSLFTSICSTFRSPCSNSKKTLTNLFQSSKSIHPQIYLSFFSKQLFSCFMSIRSASFLLLAPSRNPTSDLPFDNFWNKTFLSLRLSRFLFSSSLSRLFYLFLSLRLAATLLILFVKFSTHPSHSKEIIPQCLTPYISNHRTRTSVTPRSGTAFFPKTLKFGYFSYAFHGVLPRSRTEPY